VENSNILTRWQKKAVLKYYALFTDICTAVGCTTLANGTLLMLYIEIKICTAACYLLSGTNGLRVIDIWFYYILGSR